MNKKILTVFVVVAMIFAAFPAFCSGQKEAVVDTVEDNKTEDSIKIDESDSSVITETVSKPVVKVGETIVYQNEIDETVKAYASQGIQLTSEEVINQVIIPEILLRDLATECSSKYTSEELSQKALYSIAYEAANYYGIQLTTQEEFEQYVAELYGVSLSEYASQVLMSAIIQDYIVENYSSILEQYKVTDETIVDFYAKNIEENPDTFLIGPFAEIAHIFVEFGEDKISALTEITQILTNIKAGKISFEDACVASDDEEHTDNGGVLRGFYEKGSTDISNSFGNKASDAIFALNVGEMSNVIEGVYGYHIFKLISYTPEYKIGLDDPFNPNSTSTLREYLGSYLSYQNTAYALQVAQTQLRADLVAKATIKYFN